MKCSATAYKIFKLYNCIPKSKRTFTIEFQTIILQNSNKFYYLVLKACHKLKNTLNFGKHDKKNFHGSTWIKIEILKKKFKLQNPDHKKNHNKIDVEIISKGRCEKNYNKKKKEFKNAFKLYEFKKSFINHENIWRRYN